MTTTLTLAVVAPALTADKSCTATFTSVCPAQTICGTVTDFETGAVGLHGFFIELRSSTGSILGQTSTDNAGNIEATQTTTVKIDTTPPKTTWQLFGTDGHNARYSSDVNVFLHAADKTSGVAATYYSVDNGAWHKYHGDFMVRGIGQHHVSYYSVDKAGNVERQWGVYFQIYLLAPKLYINPLTPVNLASHLKLPLAGWTTPGTTVHVTITDLLGHSVTANAKANLAGQWSLGAVDVHTLADGKLTIRAVAANKAGQTTQVRTTTKSSRIMLAFVQQPANTHVNHLFVAIVQLRDGFGNAMNLSGQPVTVTLAPLTPMGPIGPGTLHGTLTVQTIGGQAIFRNLRVTAAGTYRLAAKDGTAKTVSTPFHIIA